MDPNSQRPDSGSLIRRPRASFQQNGQFDWFSLAKSTVTWSVEVFARLSAAGVDQYTAIVARNLCHLFQLAPIGRRNMNTALLELPCFRSLSNAIWFGVGTRHLLRDMAVTEQGTLCVGICGGLSSCYSEEVAAEVLAEMVTVSEAPVELTPSVLEWKNLVHGCGGALHMSSFPQHAERLMNLFPFRQPFTEAHRSGPICSLPSSVAKSLLAIGDVSRGAVEAITIAGGADAGWLAALSEWLFGLHIQIIRRNGEVLYESEDRDNLKKSIQILFVYQWDEEISGDRSNWSSGTRELQCVDKVYHLEKAAELFQSPSTGFMEGSETMPRVSGRLTWETALSQTFRPEFRIMIETQRDVIGRALGTAARALTAIVHNEDNMYEAIWKDPDTIQKWSRHADVTHGRGFINNMIYWFPELDPLHQTMEESSRQGYDDARSVYETQLSLLRNSCLCGFCRDNFSSGSKGQGFCKVVILETILYLGQMLSGVSVDRRLGLKRHGVEAIYETILYNRLSTGSNPSLLQRIHGALHFGLCYSDLRQLHFAIFEIFAGEAAERPSYSFGTSAYSQAGICTYLHILGEISDSREAVCQVHVTPGRIEYHGCPYDTLQDGAPLGTGGIMQSRGVWRREQTEPHRLKQLTTRLQALPSFEKPIMCVKQHTGGLQAWYESKSTKADVPCIVIPPEELARAIPQSRGFIDCSSRGGCVVIYPNVEIPKAGNLVTIEHLGKVVHIIRGGTLMRCLALSGTQCEFDLLLQSDECIQCCLRAALASPRERVIIISE